MPKAGANGTAVSSFHNFSTGDLADELGAVKAQAAEIKAREDALRTELIARDITEAEGSLFRATISTASRWTLDAERIRAEFGDAWCTAHSKVATVVSVRVSARTGATRAAA
jgi:hypothetical protein